MRSRLWSLCVAACAVALLLGCARGPSGPSGALGEWVTSRGVSVKVTLDTVNGRELLRIDFDNQTDTLFSLAAQKCTSWYEKSGRQWATSDLQLAVAEHGKLMGAITVPLISSPGDKLLKVRLEYGPRADPAYTYVRK